MKLGLVTVARSTRPASSSIATPRRTSAQAPTPGLPYSFPLFAGAWPPSARDLDPDTDAPVRHRRSLPS